MVAAVDLALKQALASPLMDCGDAHAELLCQFVGGERSLVHEGVRSGC